MPTRLPRRPPSLEALLAQVGGLHEAMPVLAQLAQASGGERYLHWDELRRRPAPQGLSHEQWWLAEKLSRRGTGTPLPLLSSEGSPFWFCQPPLLLKGLHEIDMKAGASVMAPEAVTTASTRDRYLLSSLMEEAITSSQIEGAATTRDVAKAHRIVGGRMPIIGAGGIDSGETALAKIEAGASLIQLYTGLIFEGAGLIDRIRSLRNVHLHTHAQITAMEGEGWLSTVRYKERTNGPDCMAVSMRHVFLFIGAAPNTEWLRACNVETDAKGFILTGYEAHHSCTERADYTLEWRGARIAQHTERTPDRVVVHQQGPGFRGLQVLERRRD